MRPSDPMRPDSYGQPGPPIVDVMGVHLRRRRDIERAIRLERDNKLSSDLSFWRAAVGRMGMQIPSRVHLNFYFPWASGQFTADGSTGRHGPLSGILKESLSRQAISGLVPFIEQYAHHLLRENVEAQHATRGVIDLAAFADRLAFHVISELAGFPHEPEDEQFMIAHLRDIATRDSILDIFTPEEPEVREYLWTAVHRRDKKPGSLLERVASARDRKLIDDDETLGLIFSTWAAGRETTSTLIALLFGLVDEAGLQDEMVAAAADDGAHTRRRAIEEALRFTPFPSSARVGVSDIEFGDGLAIPEGSFVHLRWEAANRDPEVFGEDANVFRPDRPPKPHMAFGHGLHFCLGATLGRLEADIAARVVYGTLGAFRITEWQRQAAFTDSVTTALAEYDRHAAARRLGVVHN